MLPARVCKCAGIDDISILQHVPNIEVLSLSVNKIGSLRYFAFCSQLKQLYLRANAIHDLAEVRYAAGSRSFTRLSAQTTGMQPATYSVQEQGAGAGGPTS